MKTNAAITSKDWQAVILFFFFCFLVWISFRIQKHLCHTAQARKETLLLPTPALHLAHWMKRVVTDLLSIGKVADTKSYRTAAVASLIEAYVWQRSLNLNTD